AQQRETGNTVAHEFGHLLEYINPGISKSVTTEEKYHSDKGENSPIDRMMNNDPATAAFRKVTQQDVDRLNMGEPLGREFIGRETSKSATKKVGIANDTKMYKDGVEQ